VAPATNLLNEVTAVILAGGLGKRLRPVVSDRPKVLANVLGRPFIEHLFERLAGYGIRRTVLCAGFMADLLDAAYREGFGDMDIAISRERELLGTGGAVRNALPLVESDPALVLNGDSYCTADFGAFYARHREAGSDRSMLLIRCGDCSDYGRVETDGDGRVRAYIEKDGSAGPGWVNAGVYLLSTAAIASIPAGGPVSMERNVFPSWIPEGILGVQLEGGFLDIGTPERLAQAEDYLTRHGDRP
jgi:D-glycero-alpha-D-manno-heptose 1-phosphate guanylyltransferase